MSLIDHRELRNRQGERLFDDALTGEPLGSESDWRGVSHWLDINLRVELVDLRDRDLLVLFLEEAFPAVDPAEIWYALKVRSQVQSNRYESLPPPAPASAPAPRASGKVAVVSGLLALVLVLGIVLIWALR